MSTFTTVNVTEPSPDFSYAARNASPRCFDVGLGSDCHPLCCVGASIQGVGGLIGGVSVGLSHDCNFLSFD